MKTPKNSKKPLLMAVLNLTPDSFSDGGTYANLQEVLDKVREFEAYGADIIDIGGEATGPNSKNISLNEELKRVVSSLKSIRRITKLPISIDTYKAEVARQALEEGANIINDITALRGDKKMATVIAQYKCPVIMMYSKENSPRTTFKEKQYKNVIATIKEFLEKRIAFAQQQGIPKNKIIIDPGMGNYVSKIPQYSFEIVARLKELKALKCPILIGISRKSFLGGKIQERDEKGALLENIAYLNGASIIRTHNIKTTRACLKWS